ncbi:unnamed protein product [Sympodiomycopsis kandeliae]
MIKLTFQSLWTAFAVLLLAKACIIASASSVDHGPDLAAATLPRSVAFDDEWIKRRGSQKTASGTNTDGSQAESESSGSHLNKLWRAGPAAKEACEALKHTFKSSQYEHNGTFTEYWEQGSNPSFQLLSSVYPKEVLPKRPTVNTMLLSVGNDYDVTKDFGYGTSGGPASKNGPLGGLPAFCRFGTFIKTSATTQVLTEVWLPLAYNPKIPLAPVNQSDFPTNTTPVEIDANGNYLKAPIWITDAEKKKSENLDLKVRDALESEFDSVVAKHDGSHKHHSHSHEGRHKDHRFKQSPLDGHKLLGVDQKNDGWNGRGLYVANGGFRGYVPLGGMKQAMARYRFAVIGSNAGHFSTTSSATWINGTQNKDTLLDWGFRATNLSQNLGSEVIKAWYGSKPKKNYFLGCSNGGKAGLASAQETPGLFDGIIAGSPGVRFSRMNAGQIGFQKHHYKNLTGDAWFSKNITQYSVHQTILDQCDALDGVVDGVVNNPLKCHPNFEKDLLCGAAGAKFGGSNVTCLTQKQIENLKGLYKPLYLNGEFIYDAFPLTWEQRSDGLTGSAKKAGGLMQLAVLKEPNLEDSKFNYWTDLTADIVKRGEREGTSWDSGKTDLSGSIKAGTKIISYHGLSDLTISPYNTIRYFEKVKKDSGVDTSKNIRFFPISGMSHCRDGEGAWNFGGSSQYDPGNRPLSFDTRHDMVLSLVAWVEKNHVEPYQVGAHYHTRSQILPPDPSSSDTGTKDVEVPTFFESYEYGVANTRKHCPWPKQAIYKGGNPNGKDGYQRYECEEAEWGSFPE